MEDFLNRKNVKIANKINDYFNILVMDTISRKIKLLVALNQNT